MKNFDFNFNANQFNGIFPFYILINDQLVVESMGKSLIKLAGNFENQPFFSKLNISRPKISQQTFEQLGQMQSEMISMQIIDTDIVLRGQITSLHVENKLLFIGSPWFGSITDLMNKKLLISDYAMHDPVIDLLHVLKTQEIVNEDLKELLETVNIQKNELKRLSEVASANRNSIIFTDVEGKIFWCNDVFKSITGFDSAEIIGTSPLKLCQGKLSDQNVVNTLIEQYRNSSPFDLQIIHYKKDGTYFWGRTNGQPIFDKHGKLAYYFTQIEDVTEIYLANLHRKKQEEKYRGIIANMNLGLIEVDNFERIKFANQSFCNMCGYEFDELIGKVASDFLVKGDNVEMMRQKVINRIEGISDAYELIVKNKKGEIKWWLVSGAPQYNDLGELEGSIGIHLDITDQKKLENELIDAREIAENSAKAKESFLANMSHEIRTPMNAIIGMSRQLARSDLNQKQKFYNHIITSSADHLLVIINDILDISKIEAGKLTFELIGFNLENVVQQSMIVMQHRAEEKALNLNVKFDDNIERVLVGDPYRLKQVLLNIISNAIKFTNKGSVTVNCKSLTPFNNKQIIVFEVIDTGIGMDKQFVSKLYSKFSQEDKSVARQFGGTGLGMSISKQLVELMGGNIDIESTKNEGTTVKIFVPLQIGSTADLPEKKSTIINPRALENIEILLVEDNEINRLVATEVLHHYGATVTEVENGKLATEIIQKQSFDIVLMDVQMPVMDGLEATQLIRSEIDKTLPIIALTANALKGESNICFEAGMNDYIAKPFDEEDLIATILKYVEPKIAAIAEAARLKPKPLYDLSSIIKISRGNKDFVIKMLRMFIEKMPIQIAELKHLADLNDMEAVGKLAHQMKPSIDNMGIESLKPVIRDIERVGKENIHSTLLNDMIATTDDITTKVIELLKTEFEL